HASSARLIAVTAIESVDSWHTALHLCPSGPTTSNSSPWGPSTTGAKRQPGGSTPPRGCVFDAVEELLIGHLRAPRRGARAGRKRPLKTAADNRAIRCNPFGARRPGARGRGHGACGPSHGGRKDRSADAPTEPSVPKLVGGENGTRVPSELEPRFSRGFRGSRANSRPVLKLGTHESLENKALRARGNGLRTRWGESRCPPARRICDHGVEREQPAPQENRAQCGVR